MYMASIALSVCKNQNIFSVLKGLKRCTRIMRNQSHRVMLMPPFYVHLCITALASWGVVVLLDPVGKAQKKTVS